MSLNLESLSDEAKTALLARIAHTLTICARDTYEFGMIRSFGAEQNRVEEINWTLKLCAAKVLPRARSIPETTFPITAGFIR